MSWQMEVERGGPVGVACGPRLDDGTNLVRFQMGDFHALLTGPQAAMLGRELLHRARQIHNQLVALDNRTGSSSQKEST